MGQAISFVQDAEKRTQDNNEKEAKDCLNVMKVLAEAKEKLFYAEIFSKNEFQSHEIPIDQIVYYDKVLRAAVEEGGQALSQEITGAIGNFATGKYLEGITTVLSKGLDVLLGNYSGNDSEKRRYIISVSDTLGVYRIDYYMYSYRFQSTSLAKITKSVTLVVFVVSSADVTKMNANTCNVVISQVFGGSDVQAQKAMAQELIAAVEKSKKEKAGLNVNTPAAAAVTT